MNWQPDSSITWGGKHAMARGNLSPALSQSAAPGTPLIPGGRIPGPGQVLLGIGPRAVERLRQLANRYPGAAYLRGDRPRFWWELPARASLDWELGVQAAHDPEAAAHAARLVALLGLEGRLELRPEALSPREQAALDLVLALVSRPRLLLWEEPLHGLDPRDRRQLARQARQVCRSLSVGIVAAARSHLSGLRELSTQPAERRALAAGR